MISALLIREGQDAVPLDMPKLRASGKTRQEIQQQSWQCKFCGQEMRPRMGAVREWHFAHLRDKSDCPFEAESERESPQHMALKHAAGDALRKYFAEDFQSLEYEVRFAGLGRIADALITLKDGTPVAVEAQLSPLTLDQLQLRTYAYLREDIDVVWVFMEHLSGGLRAGSTWEKYREWLLEEGLLVLTARAVTTEKSFALTSS